MNYSGQIKIVKKKGMSLSLYRVEDICCILLAIAPILDNYAFFTVSISFGDVIIATTALLAISTKLGKVNVRKEYLFLLAYMVIFSMMTIIEMSAIKHLISFAWFVLTLALLDSNFTACGKLIHVYKNVALFEAIVIIFQKAVFLLFGINIHGLIPGMLTTYGVSTNVYINIITGARCTGNFTEPAMAARYLAFPLFFSVFKIIEKKRIANLETVIFVVAMVCTYSGNAIVALVIAFLYYLIYQLKLKEKGENKIVKLIIGAFFVIVGMYVLNQVIGFEYLWNRRTELSGHGATGVSGYIRITRGFVVYGYYNLFQKIFGLGIGNYRYAVNHQLNAIASMVTDKLLDYMNGIQFYLLQGGIIGIFLFLNLYKPIIKHHNSENIWLGVMLLTFMITSGISTSSLFVLFHIIVLKYDKCKQAYDE